MEDLEGMPTAVSIIRDEVCREYNEEDDDNGLSY